jgi:hypothetical protein
MPLPLEGANMPVIAASKQLRYVLWADAISCLMCGGVQVAFTRSLAHDLGFPPMLLLATGNFLLLYAAAVAFLATRARASSAIIGLLIVGNLVWGIAAVSVLLSGEFEPTILGKAYAVAQALTVAVLAKLQYYFGFRSRAQSLAPLQ